MYLVKHFPDFLVLYFLMSFSTSHLPYGTLFKMICSIPYLTPNLYQYLIICREILIYRSLLFTIPCASLLFTKTSSSITPSTGHMPPGTVEPKYSQTPALIPPVYRDWCISYQCVQGVGFLLTKAACYTEYTSRFSFDSARLKDTPII